MIRPLKNIFSQQRSSLSALQLLLLTIALAAPASLPFRAMAQQPEPMDAAGPLAPKKVAAAETHQSQEEQDKVFLLGGPIVKWTARTFNMPVETAANIYEIINFVALVLLIGIPIARVTPKIFRKRSQTLGHNLKTAREATEDAQSRLKAVEAQLAGLDNEIKKLQVQVEQENAEDEKRIKASIGDESARIVQAAEQELNVAAEHARRSLRLFAAELVIEQAAKEIQLSAETDRALIEEFISSVSADGKERQN